MGARGGSVPVSAGGARGPAGPLAGGVRRVDRRQLREQRFAALGPAERLPVLDLLAAHFLVRVEFADRPMRTVVNGLTHGL
mgnify:CR=1 FL=1